MDGIHDLGGKQGYGPIPIGTGDVFFDHDWEERMWAIARAGVAHGITIDWFRHGLERMVPKDYVSFAYFNKWCTNYLMLLIDNGVITKEEAIAGHVETPDAPAEAKSLDDVLATTRASNFNFAVPTDAKPRFTLGDQITTKRRVAADHTRLPAYATGSTGTIITHHGAHPLADANAHGVEKAEHLYTVSFTATELWGPDANPLDTVTLELWESYFV